jgi:hypothetical protein
MCMLLEPSIVRELPMMHLVGVRPKLDRKFILGWGSVGATNFLH